MILANLLATALITAMQAESSTTFEMTMRMAPQGEQGDSAPTFDALELGADAVQNDLRLLRRALGHLHPGLTRYASEREIDAAFRNVGLAGGKSTSDLAFYRAVSVACATIRCGHTRVMSPRIDAFREKVATQLPFTFRIFGKTMIVDTIVGGVPLQRGDEVVRIEGRSVDTLIDEIGATVCLDGFTDSVRSSRLDTAYEFDDSGLDHYLPAWIGFRSRFRIEFVRDGKTEKLIVDAVDRGALRALTSPVRDFADSTSVVKLDQDTALLTIGSFVNYRKPVSATERYRDLFRKIRDTGCGHLIVDLRSNGGGSSDASEPLARFLVESLPGHAQPPIVKNYRCPEDLRTHLSTWQQDAWDLPATLFESVAGGYEMKVPGVVPKWEPDPDRFRGRVTVLTSRYNASGSTMLIAALKQAGVRLVGETTGGAPRGPTAGLLFTLTLPASQLTINIPAVLQRTGLSYPEGKGVTPDVVVETTREDFLERRDHVLEKARVR